MALSNVLMVYCVLMSVGWLWLFLLICMLPLPQTLLWLCLLVKWNKSSLHYKAQMCLSLFSFPFPLGHLCKLQNAAVAPKVGVHSLRALSGFPSPAFLQKVTWEAAAVKQEAASSWQMHGDRTQPETRSYHTHTHAALHFSVTTHRYKNKPQTRGNQQLEHMLVYMHYNLFLLILTLRFVNYTVRWHQQERCQTLNCPVGAPWPQVQQESKSSNSQNICRSRTGTKHLLSDRPLMCCCESKRRKNNRETFFFFFWGEPAGRPAEAKRKHGQLFLTQVKLTNGLDFPIPCHFVPYTPEFYCLARTWGRKKERKKEKKTAHTGVCFGTLGLTGQCCLVDVSPGNLFACKETERCLVPGEEKQHSEGDSSGSVKGRYLFSTPVLQPCFDGRGTWDAVLEGRLEDQVLHEKYRGPPSQGFKKLFLTSALTAPFSSAAV